MPILVATIVLLAVAVYLVIGIVVGVAFVTVGVGVVDHAARGAPWGFRALILPGSAALWPVILVKWTRASRDKQQ